MHQNMYWTCLPTELDEELDAEELFLSSLQRPPACPTRRWFDAHMCYQY
eukprot:gene11545-biopygen8115